MKKAINILLIAFFAFSNIALGMDNTLRVPVDKSGNRVAMTIINPPPVTMGGAGGYSLNDLNKFINDKTLKINRDTLNKIGERLAWSLASPNHWESQKAEELLSKFKDFKKETTTIRARANEIKAQYAERESSSKLTVQKPVSKQHPEREPEAIKPASKTGAFGELHSKELIGMCLDVIKAQPAFGASIYVTPEDITNRGLNFKVKHPYKEGESLNFSISAKYDEWNKVSCIEVVIGGTQGLVDSIRLNNVNEIKLKDAQPDKRSKLEKSLKELAERIKPKKTIESAVLRTTYEGPWNKAIKDELIKMPGNDIIVPNFLYSPEEMTITFYKPEDVGEKLYIIIENTGTMDKPYLDARIYHFIPLRHGYRSDKGDNIDSFSATDSLYVLIQNLKRYIISSSILQEWQSEIKEKAQNNKAKLLPYVERIMKDFLTPEELIECNMEEPEWEENNTFVKVIFSKKYDKSAMLILQIRFLPSENIGISAYVEIKGAKTDEFCPVRYTKPQEMSISHFNDIRNNVSAKTFLRTRMHSFMFTIIDNLMNDDPDIALFKKYNNGFIKGTSTKIIQQRQGDYFSAIDIYNPLTQNFRLTLSMQYDPAENAIYASISKVEIRSRTPESASLGKFRIHDINMDDVTLQSCIKALKEDTPFKDWLNIIKKEIEASPSQVTKTVDEIKYLFKDMPDSIKLQESGNVLTYTAQWGALRFRIEGARGIIYEKLGGGDFEEIKGLSLESAVQRFLYVNDIVTKFLSTDERIMKNVGVKVDNAKVVRPFGEDRIVTFFNKSTPEIKISFILTPEERGWSMTGFVYGPEFGDAGKEIKSGIPLENTREYGQYLRNWIYFWLVNIKKSSVMLKFMPQLLAAPSAPLRQPAEQGKDIITEIKALFQDAPGGLTVEDSLDESKPVESILTFSLGSNKLLFRFDSFRIYISQILGAEDEKPVLVVAESKVTEDIRLLVQKFLYLNDIATKFLTPEEMKNAGTRIVGSLKDEKIEVEFFNKVDTETKIIFRLKHELKGWRIEASTNSEYTLEGIGDSFQYHNKYYNSWISEWLYDIRKWLAMRKFMPKLLADKPEEEYTDTELVLNKETVEHSKALVEAYARLYVLYLNCKYGWNNLKEDGFYNDTIAGDLRTLRQLDDGSVHKFLYKFQGLVLEKKMTVNENKLYADINHAAHNLSTGKNIKHTAELIENLDLILETVEAVSFFIKSGSSQNILLNREALNKLVEAKDPAVLLVLRHLKDTITQKKLGCSQMALLDSAIKNLETIAKKYDMTFANGISMTRSAI